jgi:predicted DsbA family dithiol-disulfide isomerase
MLAKGGGRVPLEHFFAAPRRSGAAIGLVFNFEKIKKAPNTLLAHRLVAIAPSPRQEEVIDAIYGAYFEDGRDIGDRETLVRIAEEVGMEPVETRALLQDEAGREKVLVEARMAQAAGINGVPFFVLNNHFAFSGAHPPQRILGLLAHVAAEGQAAGR